MGTTITLKAEDGHQLSAHEAKPQGAPRGAIVVVQEIFGVNSHIRAVADGYAAAGYHAIAPALYDRTGPGLEFGYEPQDIEAGRSVRQKIAPDDMLKDIAAARDALKASGKVGVVGYCLGGSLAWLSATRLDGIAAAVGYYGSLVAPHATERPRCPVMLHFGETDHSIPMSDVETVQQTVDPAEVQVFVYPAGHGFNCDQRGSWHAESAELARSRSLDFFARHLA